jgi:archaeosine-15-forming tRNA-guanine transglycosylase
MPNEVSESSISRVTIKDAAVPYIARGGRLFSGQVVASDPGIEDGERVMVVDRKNNPIRMIQIFKET